MDQGWTLLKLAQDKTVANLRDSGGGIKVKDMHLDFSATINGRDALKQLLDHTTDGVKCTWNLSVKSTATNTTPSSVVSMEVWSMERCHVTSCTSIISFGSV